MEGTLDPQGEQVWWFDDTDGDEFGRWMVEPFGGGDRREAAPELGRAYGAGLEVGRSMAVIGRSTEQGSSIHVVSGEGNAREIYANEEQSWLGGLSDDEQLVCFHHSEHGDSRHADLRVVDRVGAIVAELSDGPGLGLHSAGFPPVAGDDRVLVLHEREDLKRPLIWWPRTGETRTFELELPGDVEASWYPDGSAVLFVHEHAGRSDLYRLDVASERLEQLPTQPGTIAVAGARPDGEVWYQWSDSATSPQIRSTSSGLVLRPPGDAAPQGIRYSDLWVGDVHALVVEPAAPRPHPTIFAIHGGPEAHDRDTFSPPIQAYVDHGLAVVQVNYRGSTGYGRAWRDALTGNPGLTELHDIDAVWRRVVDEGIADPERVAISGASWGGYLTLLAIGRHPDRWAAAVAGVPVADYVAAFEDEAPSLQAMDRGLFGGGPEEYPELYRERSPITYVDRVKTPLMVLAGENDSRCPIRQIDNYLASMRERGLDPEVYRYDTGHASYVVDERVRQMAAAMRFVLSHVRVDGA